MDVKKIVRCLPEQFQELLETGQVEVDGKIKTKEDDVLYDTGYLEFIEWHNKFMQAQYEQVKVNHTPMAMKSLEQEYEELTADEGGKESAYVSAVGFTAVLKVGDTIRTGAPNSGCFYINGERLTHDYTYNGDGYEVVNVWVFEDNYALELNDAPAFSISELNIKNLMTTPVISNRYTLGALVVEVYNYRFNSFSGASVKKFISKGAIDYNQPVIGISVIEVESDCTQFNSSVIKFPFASANVKKIILPEITSMSGAMFNNINGRYDVEIYTPKLTTIKGSTNNNTYMCVKNVIIPNSVRTVGEKVCTLNDTITLNCNRATIDSDWCNSTPSVNFDMCDDWYPSINIAVAAAKHSIDWFFPRYDETGKLKYATPLFTHILRNFAKDNEDALSQAQPGEEVILQSGWIKLPDIIYEQMTAEDRELAASIGWDLLDDPYKTTEV